MAFSYLEYLHWHRLNRGIIRISFDIDTDYTSDILTELDYLSENNIKNITIYISSFGGGVYHAFAIYDVLISLRNKGFTIDAIVEGHAASAAAMIVLQAVDRRKARKNARFMLHEPSRWIFAEQPEKTSALKDSVKELEYLTNSIIKVLTDRCKKSEEEIKNFIERKEIWMSAQEAKDFGLIDEVL